MLGVGDGVADDVAEEARQDVADFLVDVEGDALDAAATGEPPDGGLGDALNQGPRSLARVPLDADLADAFAAFSTFANSCHLLILPERPALIPPSALNNPYLQSYWLVFRVQRTQRRSSFRTYLALLRRNASSRFGSCSVCHETNCIMFNERLENPASKAEPCKLAFK